MEWFSFFAGRLPGQIFLLEDRCKMDLKNGVGEKVRMKEINMLEARLKIVMAPVDPRPEFVHNLKSSLLHQPETTLKDPDQGFLQYILWGTAGVLSGALILVFGIKAVSGLLGSLPHLKKQVEQSPSTLGTAT
jgi:hypothetical protein